MPKTSANAERGMDGVESRVSSVYCFGGCVKCSDTKESQGP